MCVFCGWNEWVSRCFTQRPLSTGSSDSSPQSAGSAAHREKADNTDNLLLHPFVKIIVQKQHMSDAELQQEWKYSLCGFVFSFWHEHDARTFNKNI